NIRSYNFTAIRSNKSGKSEGRVALSFSPASTEGANQPNLSWFEFDKPDENGRINVKLDEIIFKNAKLYLYGVTSKSNDVEISKVHLGTCKNTLCKEVADFGNGTYGIVHIYSTEGSLQERNPPIDISSDDFKIAVKIIKTIRFYKEYHFP
ncbi:hypothetical protein KKG52_03365, partial [Patescibacteria group bacterium]|nr:hypothetical protein [Patescibacteria group bacterium]